MKRKTAEMDESRSKHKPNQNGGQMALEGINPQRVSSNSHGCSQSNQSAPCLFNWGNNKPTHGSPYHVHPYPSPVRLQHAFQNQNSPKMFHPKGLKPHPDARAFGTPQPSPILGRALCLTPRGSPVPGRVSHLNDKFQQSLTLNSDTNTILAKISAMFPTVSETHIKILLKKYYNREAVVISALKVEKHPIATPGPSPCLDRHVNHVHKGVHAQLAKGYSGSMHGSSHFTPTSGTPHGSPFMLRSVSGASSYYGARSVEGQPAKQHSPKMKLKYLKSIFPGADETVILDILANKDNNVQKASEELLQLGFQKKEMHKKKDAPLPPQPTKRTPSIAKTDEAKTKLKQMLQQKYPHIAERVITIALESVNFNEDLADQVLSNVNKEEKQVPKQMFTDYAEIRHVQPDEIKKGTWPAFDMARAASPPPPARRYKPWAATPKPILKTNTGTENRYKSQYTTTRVGPNPSLRQGPKDYLLLADYLPWTGPDPELRHAQFVTPQGPEPYTRTPIAARGPSGLAKGPAGLAKGSKYQVTKKTAKIVI